jgi:DNA (cytosine-5)-methyltransferase 1
MALIRKFRPDWIFGEQVATAIGAGWLDGVSTDLEGQGYACGAVVLGAHSVGAPHIRQRLYWVGHAIQPRLEGHAWNGVNRDQPGRINPEADRSATQTGGIGHWNAYGHVHCLDGKSRRIEPGSFPLAHGVSGRVGLLRGYGNAIVPQLAAEFIKATS